MSVGLYLYLVPFSDCIDVSREGLEYPMRTDSDMGWTGSGLLSAGFLGRRSITPQIHVTHKHQFCPADVTPSPSQSSRNTHSTWSWTSGATALIDCCSLQVLIPPLQKKKGGTPWAKKYGNRTRLHPWSGHYNLNTPIYLSTCTYRYMEIYRDGKLRVQSLYTCMYPNEHTSRKKEPEDTLVNHTDISPRKSSYAMKCPRTQSKYMDDTPWH